MYKIFNVSKNPFLNVLCFWTFSRTKKVWILNIVLKHIAEYYTMLFTPVMVQKHTFFFCWYKSGESIFRASRDIQGVFQGAPQKQTHAGNISATRHHTVNNLVLKHNLLNQEFKTIHNSNHPKCNSMPDLMGVTGPLTLDKSSMVGKALLRITSSTCSYQAILQMWSQGLWRKRASSVSLTEKTWEIINNAGARFQFDNPPSSTVILPISVLFAVKSEMPPLWSNGWKVEYVHTCYHTNVPCVKSQ